MSQADSRMPTDPDIALEGTYEPGELALLQTLVDSLLDEMIDSGDYLLAEKNRDALRTRLAMAVFQCADAGERDPAVLRRRVIEIFRAPASSRTAA